MAIKAKPLPSQERLKELFDYCPSGNLIRIKKTGCKGRLGQIVGYTDKKHGYITVGVDGKAFMLHRLIWMFHNGTDPVDGIDHLNRDATDNRIENLRECNQHQNGGNCKPGKGYHKQTLASSFSAKIKVNRESIYLGTFPTEQEAQQAYREAHAKHFREFSPYYT